MKALTLRQNEILSFVKKFISIHSYPPTIREIADNFKMSIKGAHDHITALKKKGAIRQSEKCSRTIELIKGPDDEADGNDENNREIPILGTVAAGQPILTEENWDGVITMHRTILKKNKKYFALRVRGDSMIGIGIMDGDMAIVETQAAVDNGEIAVVVTEEAATLKRFYREATRIRLQAENPAYKPMYYQDVRVLGRLAHIFRSY